MVKPRGNAAGTCITIWADSGTPAISQTRDEKHVYVRKTAITYILLTVHLILGHDILINPPLSFAPTTMCR